MAPCWAIIVRHRRRTPVRDRLLCANPLQDVHEIIVGIDPLQAAGTEQTLDDTKMLCAEFGPTEEPVFSPQGNGSDLALDVVGVDGHVGLFQEDLQRSLAAVDIGPGPWRRDCWVGRRCPSAAVRPK